MDRDRRRVRLATDRRCVKSLVVRSPAIEKQGVSRQNKRSKRWISLDSYGCVYYTYVHVLRQHKRRTKYCPVICTFVRV